MFQFIKDLFRGYPLLGRSSQWRRVRKEHVKPNCEMCNDKRGLEVHHIRPVHLFPELELDPKNLITLCGWRGYRCHFVWGHLKNYKEWNKTVKKDAKYLIGKLEE